MTTLHELEMALIGMTEGTFKPKREDLEAWLTSATGGKMPRLASQIDLTSALGGPPAKAEIWDLHEWNWPVIAVITTYDPDFPDGHALQQQIASVSQYDDLHNAIVDAARDIASSLPLHPGEK